MTLKMHKPGLPDCMMPDGGQACAYIAWQEQRIERLEKAVLELERYTDAIVCYASTTSEHDANRVVKLFSDLKAEILEDSPPPVDLDDLVEALAVAASDSETPKGDGE